MKRAAQSRWRGCATFAFIAAALASPVAHASAPGTFGQGTRSAGLAQADVADPDAASAASSNAAAAAEPGARLRIGWGIAILSGLRIEDPSHRAIGDAPRNASGLDLALQLGHSFSRDTSAGVSFAAHVPDGYLARVAFRPATEPQFVLDEASLQRTTLDLVAGLRHGVFSFGAGASLGLSVGGRGSALTLGQDARGTYADAAVDAELPYRAAPIVGARVDLGWLAVGATFRGGLGTNVAVDATTTVALANDPLDGTTKVHVAGTSGYDPPVVALGARLQHRSYGGKTAALFAALVYSGYSAAPAPVADVGIDLHLGTTPSLREARFVEPRFRDTIGARIGIEGSGAPAEPGAAPWYSLRAGYAFVPSPIPPQTGFTSYADASRHVIAAGGTFRLGRLAGVEFLLSYSGQLHWLVTRHEDKRSEALPYAHYDVSGFVPAVAAAIEGRWR